ncbi:MAG: hypothetical protein ACUVQG_10045 [Thermogutta sp.]
MWIDMGYGNDLVQLVAFNVPNELHVNLGAGNDVLEAGAVRGSTANQVRGALWIEGKDGNDVVTLANTHAAQNVWVKLNGGNDTFCSWSSQVDGTSVSTATTETILSS